jgi:hypothetical protein
MGALHRATGLLVLLALAALAPAGCGAGGGSARESVSGTVTFDGQPLQRGTIEFQPASQTEGALATGAVTDGRFEIPRGEGPTPGNYGVAIYNAGDAPPPLAPGELPGPPKFNTKHRAADVPPRYNTQSELTAEVKAGGPNRYTFDLKR